MLSIHNGMAGVATVASSKVNKLSSVLQSDLGDHIFQDQHTESQEEKGSMGETSVAGR